MVHVKMQSDIHIYVIYVLSCFVGFVSFCCGKFLADAFGVNVTDVLRKGTCKRHVRTMTWACLETGGCWLEMSKTMAYFHEAHNFFLWFMPQYCVYQSLIYTLMACLVWSIYHIYKTCFWSYTLLYLEDLLDHSSRYSFSHISLQFYVCNSFRLIGMLIECANFNLFELMALIMRLCASDFSTVNVSDNFSNADCFLFVFVFKIRCLFLGWICLI